MQQVFPQWFREYVLDPRNNVTCPHLRNLCYGPLRQVRTFNKYFVNGWKFHTASWSATRRTNNSGICVKGETGQGQDDYYGLLEDILEVEYPGLPLKRVILFSCQWFDPTLGVGKRIHPTFKLVEIKHRSRYRRYDPFIVAQNACQVYYLPYPEKRRDTQEWWVAVKTRPVGRVLVDDTLEVAMQEISTDVGVLDDQILIGDCLADDTAPPVEVRVQVSGKRIRGETSQEEAFDEEEDEDEDETTTEDEEVEDDNEDSSD